MTYCIRSKASRSRSRSARGRPDSTVRSRNIGLHYHRQTLGLQTPYAVVHRNRPALSEHLETQTTADGRVLRFLSLVNRIGYGKYCVTCWTRTNFYHRTASARCHASIRNLPSPLVRGAEYWVNYEPAESSTGLFGGNSNWRGPIWFPVNYLLIESLQKFHYYLDDSYTVEFPTGSGHQLTLWDVAAELSRRLSRIFLRGPDERRPVYGVLTSSRRPALEQLVTLLRIFFMATTPQASARATKLAGRISSKIVTTKRRVREKRKSE